MSQLIGNSYKNLLQKIILIIFIFYFYTRHGSHISPGPVCTTRVSPSHPLSAAGQPLYQADLYRRPAVYVTTTQPTYIPANPVQQYAG